MEPWEIAITVGAVVTAVSIVWHKALGPLVRAAIAIQDFVTEEAPILKEIARDFDGNGHSTLSKRLDRIEAGVEDTRREVGGVRHEVNNVRQVVMNTVELGTGDAWRLDQERRSDRE